MRRVTLGLMLFCLLCADAAAGGRWIHVRVQDLRGGDDSISVNVPLSMIGSFLPEIDIDDFTNSEDGWIGLDRGSAGVSLREILDAVRDAPDGEFLRIRSRDENVRVVKENGFLRIDVDEPDGDRVRIRLPIEVVEAMLASDEDRIDLEAALDALADFDGEDLITVESDDSTIRIWIDDRENGD